MDSSVSKNKEQNSSSSSSSSWFGFCTNFQCFPAKISSSKSSPPLSDDDLTEKEKASQLQKRKPGGWKAMPFVLGNETFERLASIGLLANFMVFLLTQFHMDQVLASNVLNVWSGFTNFSPLIGAYVSDSYLGKFTTIAFASLSTFMGMVTLTLIASLPHLRPPKCNVQAHEKCIGPTKSQFGVLALGLGLLSIGASGIRPCSLPFGVDQFDSNTEEGRKGIASFFNWYYTSFTVVLIIALTLVVYIQDSVSWAWGFGIPTMLMFCSIILFFVGTRFYVYVNPEGSVFSGIAQVIIASYKKRNLKLPPHGEQDGVYYDPPFTGVLVRQIPLSNQLRFLNKAALITQGEVLPDGTTSNQWRLSSIQRVEETKCLFKVIPIWASGIMCFTAIAQQGTFTVSQATKMNRHLGPNFQIPVGSLAVMSMITIGIWLPIYDRVIVPRLRKVTKVEGGITLLQRMGIGIVFSILSMIAAGLVERMRRAASIAYPDTPMSVFWLAPQLILMGFAEAFNIIGQIEFYNKEFPESMSSVANSLFSCTMAGANYLSAVVVNVVHNTTGIHGRPDWLTKDINAGKVDYFYYLIAGMGVLNLGYFLWISRRYQYKSRVRIDDEKSDFDVELNVVKKH